MVVLRIAELQLNIQAHVTVKRGHLQTI